MFRKEEQPLDNISMGQLQIYLAVANHDLRKARLDCDELCSKIKDIINPSSDDKSVASNPQVIQYFRTNNRRKKLEKRVEVISLLIEYKSDLLQSPISQRGSTSPQTFSEFMKSKKLEDELISIEISSQLESEIYDRITLPHTPDVSDVQQILTEIGFSGEEIRAITGTCSGESQKKPVMEHSDRFVLGDSFDESSNMSGGKTKSIRSLLMER